MVISYQFNKFYHSLLNDAYLQVLSKAEVKLVLTFDRFKTMLKYLDKNYPRYENTEDLVSTRDITNADLIPHIDFIIKWCGEYGITPRYIEDEWERLLQSAHA